MRVGAWLSLVERLVRDQEAGGSNPLAPTNPLPISALRLSPRAGTTLNSYPSFFRCRLLCGLNCREISLDQPGTFSLTVLPRKPPRLVKVHDRFLLIPGAD